MQTGDPTGGLRTRTFLVVELLMWILRRAREDVRQDTGGRETLHLTRWTLLRARGRRLLLHRFHRADYHGQLHDHSWSFVSLILWPGYYEHTEAWPGRPTWYGPLSVLRRRAEMRHYTQVAPGRGCWTLVLAGPHERDCR